MTGTGSTVDQPATEQDPANVPARPARSRRRPARHVRRQGTGDTSGYGGLVRRSVYPGRPSARTAAGSTRSPTPSRRAWPPPTSTRRSRTSWCTAARSPSTSAASTSPRDADAARRRGAALRVLRRRERRALPRRAGRELHAVYHLLSMTHNRRIRVEVTCPDADPHIPSVVAVYPTADWHERETYDFFGIIFDGHPALTRIEMPDDWPGHPQRKDYPSAASPSSTRAPRFRRRTSGGPTTDDATPASQNDPYAAAGRRPATAGSSPSPARTGTPSSRASTTRPTSASSSTWARSTRRRTACSG